MKNFLLIVVGAIIGSLICYFLLRSSTTGNEVISQKKKIEMAFLPEEELELIQLFEDELQQEYNLITYDTDDGDFVSKDSLDRASDRYDNISTILRNITGRVFPRHFFFGLNKTDSLRKVIRYINRNTSDPDSSIVGIVIRMGFKSDTTRNGTRGFRLEPYIIPVRRNKSLVTGPIMKDIVGDGGFGGLDESKPCPTQCP